VETQYFWPDLAADMREVFRVLKPGSSFILIAEVYKGGQKMAKKLSEKHVEMKILSVEEHCELFARTGYAEIQVIEEREKEWLCGIGRKPPIPR
jgi:ubiquinone/menaquinone biosynthesis C-methylase UbiE